eukprot:CAMPEP_0197642878 /NCGR_PEP_ID=MMETSP1338-20131121/16400_1 /TAXON_ID=43686 ORGANISM="Pelagodinium beii, Strain RCC1491" /NCGR_SAMPLE_ID=MMETSP1338 /ASSEMBLY_ACC=CAM_ASM_000754 /LENGTH=251 /DNA_ID=CAMNT_0043216065 /DNA_START=49 /DNA_END=804 /DNA_ORIENTATION=-
MEWKKILLLAGATAGSAAVLWYLLKEDKSAGKLAASSEDERRRLAAKPSVEEITKEQVRQILKEIINSQDQMKGFIKELTQELLSQSLSFDETYKKVRAVQPKDPLESHGLSMTDFDKLLDKYQQDPDVRDSIAKIMGAPSPSNMASEKVQSISVRKVIEVHNFMLQELEKLVEDFQKVPGKEGYDMKTVTIAAQAIVGSKIEAKFGLTSEDIESAVLMYHANLATDQDFAQVNIKIQHAMGKLMGTTFTN